MKKLFTRRNIIITFGIVFAVGFAAVFFTKCSPLEDNSTEEILPNPKNDEPVHIVSTATIGSTGDILIHSPFLPAYYDETTQSHNFDKIFTHLEPYIKKLDYSVINLEVTLADKNFSGYPLFRCPDSLIDSAKSCGFDMFLTATNHSNDGGASGFTRTVEVLKNKNVDFIGTRLNSEDKKYIIKDINGIKVGMVNYTYGDISGDGVVSVNGIPATSANSRLINVFDYNKLEKFYSEQAEIIAEINQLGADKIIYYMHWGNEYQLKPNATQKAIAQKLCDLGVDVIVGGHPHVIQPMDVLHSDISGKDTICIYSVGNSVSNQRQEIMDMKSGHTEDGVLFTVAFTKLSDGTVFTSDVEVIPTWVHLYRGKNGKKVYQIVPLDKNVDWSRNFNLSATSNGIERANKSYNRTMQLLSEGQQKAKNLLSQKLKEAYPHLYE